MTAAIAWLSVIGALLVGVGASVWGYPESKPLAIWIFCLPGTICLAFAGALELQKIANDEGIGDPIPPYMFVDAITLVERGDQNEKRGAAVRIRNTGSLPALQVRHWAGIGVRAFPLSVTLAGPPEGMPFSSDGLGPGMNSTTYTVLPNALTDAEIQGVQGGSLAIFVWGNIEYADPKGGKHSTDYRYFAGGATGIAFPPRFAVAPEGNNAK